MQNCEIITRPERFLRIQTAGHTIEVPESLAKLFKEKMGVDLDFEGIESYAMSGVRDPFLEEVKVDDNLISWMTAYSLLVDIDMRCDFDIKNK